MAVVVSTVPPAAQAGRDLMHALTSDTLSTTITTVEKEKDGDSDRSNSADDKEQAQQEQSKSAIKPKAISHSSVLGCRPIVMDAVYLPKWTPLLITADNYGCAVIHGEQMLHEQVRKAFSVALT